MSAKSSWKLLLLRSSYRFNVVMVITDSTQQRRIGSVGKLLLRARKTSFPRTQKSADTLTWSLLRYYSHQVKRISSIMCCEPGRGTDCLPDDITSSSVVQPITPLLKYVGLSEWRSMVIVANHRTIIWWTMKMPSQCHDNLRTSKVHSMITADQKTLWNGRGIKSAVQRAITKLKDQIIRRSPMINYHLITAILQLSID